MEEQGGYETDATQYEAKGIGLFACLEQRQYHSPDGLHGEQHAYPVARFLIAGALDVRSAPHRGGNGTVGVGPHVHESGPAEKLYQPYRPKHFGSMLQQGDKVGFFLLFVRRDTMELFKLFGRHLRALVRRVADPDKCEDEWEKIAHQATRIAQETLNGVGQPFLFLVHHVTHQHLERLHRHIDGSIEKHQRYQSEDHGRADCHTETSRIRQ